MNVTSILTKDYENKSNWKLGENKANTKPIKANTNPIPERPKMNENLFATKGYENITTFGLRQNKPNQTQPVVSLPVLSLGVYPEPKGREGVEPISKAKNAALPSLAQGLPIRIIPNPRVYLGGSHGFS